MKRIAIFDSETTGLDPTKDAVIEVGCIVYDLVYAAPVESFSSVIFRSDGNPAWSINRIPSGILATGRTASAVWSTVREHIFMADAVVAHRAEFDRSFMPADIQTMRPFVCSKFHIEWPLSKIGDDLVHACLAHGVGVVNAHRALTDCDLLARLFTRVKEMGHDLVKLMERAMRPRVRVVAVVSYDDREKAKQAGFAWSPERREWWRDMPVEDVDALPFRTRVVLGNPTEAPL